MISNDKYLLTTQGILIYNNRNEKDYACIDDNEYSGMT
jgi:hypothetical protein